MVLPPALDRLRGKLKSKLDGDKQMVMLLSAALVDGLEAVESAAAEALRLSILVVPTWC